MILRRCGCVAKISLTFSQEAEFPERRPDRLDGRALNRSDALSIHRLLSARQLPGSLPIREWDQPCPANSSVERVCSRRLAPKRCRGQRQDQVHKSEAKQNALNIALREGRISVITTCLTRASSRYPLLPWCRLQPGFVLQTRSSRIACNRFGRERHLGNPLLGLIALRIPESR
jgi:hypothetical protein